MPPMERPNARRFLAAILLVSTMGLAWGCNASASSPEQAFRSFVGKLQAGDVDGAWDLLSRDSQDELSRIVHERSVESGGAIPDDPKRVILQDASLTRPIDEVEVEALEGDRAILTVRSGGETMPVQMVREEGRWKVALIDVR